MTALQRDECLDTCVPCDDCCECLPEASAVHTRRLVRTAWGLTVFTIIWNALEGAAAAATGWMAQSPALIGFALDSLVETASALIVTWWLSRGRDDPVR